MAKKITKLTPEQIGRFGEWSEKWIEIGLSTEPADFDKATAAALRAYQLANFKRPMVILRMSSPYGATLGGALAWAVLRKLSDKQVGAQVGAQYRDRRVLQSLAAKPHRRGPHLSRRCRRRHP